MKTKKMVLIFLISWAMAFPLAALEPSPPPMPVRPEDRQTMFNAVTDLFATVGTTGQERKEILKERKSDRRQARFRAQERKRKVRIRNQMKQQEKIMMEKIRAEQQAVGQ